MGIQIHFNGKTYNSIEEMPPEARQAYEQALALLADQNANGLPDFVDGLMQGQSPEEVLKPLNTLSSTFTQVVYNGQTYASPEAMPPEARRAYEQAMGALDQNANGLPDAFENIGFKAGAASPAPGPAATPSSAPMPYTPAGLDSGPSGSGAGRTRFVALAVFALAALFLIAAVLLVVFVAGPALVGLR
jgi:hypothetical protein